MKSCRLFRKVGLGQCLAVDGEHVPLIQERECHCNREGWGCQVLAMFMARGRRLSQREYLEALSPENSSTYPPCNPY